MGINIKNVIISVIVTIMCISLAGCSDKTVTYYQDESLKAPEDKEYDIFMYSYKDDEYDKFANLCSIYESETGVKIKLIPIDQNQKDMDSIMSYVNGDQKADIIPVRDLNELSYYKDHSMLMNLDNASGENFKQLISNIDPRFKLSDDKYNYLLPSSICGYGYLADKAVLENMFNSSDTDMLIRDLKDSSYLEFENFVKASSSYIKNNNSSSVILNGNKYYLNENKKANCKSLIDVFSFAGADNSYYGKFLSNIAFNAVFLDSKEAYNASDSKLNLMKNPLTAYAKLIDLETSYTSGENYSLKRGTDFVDQNINGYEKSLEEFLNGKSLFFRDSSSVGLKIYNLNPDIYNRLIFIPIKLPLKNEDISLANVTVSDINSSLTVYVPLYYAINNNSENLNKKLSQDFLVWLNTSDIAKNYLINELKVIPYDYKNNNFQNDSLNSFVVSFLNSNKTLNALFKGFSQNWADETFAQYIKESCLTKSQWTQQTYTEISDYGINKYNKLKNK